MNGDDLATYGLIVGCTGVLLTSMHGVITAERSLWIALLFVVGAIILLSISFGLDAREVLSWYRERDAS